MENLVKEFFEKCVFMFKPKHFYYIKNSIKKDKDFFIPPYYTCLEIYIMGTTIFNGEKAYYGKMRIYPSCDQYSCRNKERIIIKDKHRYTIIEEKYLYAVTDSHLYNANYLIFKNILKPRKTRRRKSDGE